MMMTTTRRRKTIPSWSQAWIIITLLMRTHASVCLYVWCQWIHFLTAHHSTEKPAPPALNSEAEKLMVKNVRKWDSLRRGFSLLFFGEWGKREGKKKESFEMAESIFLDDMKIGCLASWMACHSSKQRKERKIVYTFPSFTFSKTAHSPRSKLIYFLAIINTFQFGIDLGTNWSLQNILQLRTLFSETLLFLMYAVL